MIGNLWPVFAAMDGVAATDGTTRKDGIDDFPDESPTDKQMGRGGKTRHFSGQLR